ncbi:MAG: hypothetical protein AAF950_14400 [Pseudomonadota bacterium]
MTSNVTESLPRFDEPGKQPLPGELALALSTDMSSEDARDEPMPQAADNPPPEETVPVVEEELVEAPNTLGEEHIAELSTLLKKLDSACQDIDAKLESQVSKSILEISERLFPYLSRIFFGREIAHYISALVPKTEPQVTISAPPPLMLAINNAVKGDLELPSNCTLVSNVDIPEASVRIDWKTGGATADFNKNMTELLSQFQDQERSDEDLSR